MKIAMINDHTHHYLTRYTPRHNTNNIIRQGSDVNHRSNTGSTALHEAVCLGNISGVKLLVKHGADVNIQNDAGYTPLHYATNKSRNTILNFLIKNNANWMICSNEGETPLLRAKRHRNLKAFNFLAELHNFSISPTQSESDKQLFRDAKQQAPRRIDRWLIQGTNPKICDDYGTTALDIVVKNGNIKCLELFRKNNINLYQTNDIGENTLFLAAQYSTVECMEYLFDNGAEMGYTDFKGQTVLHAAAYAQDLDIVKYLLDLGVDHSVKDIQGKTALDVAKDTRNQPMIGLLEPFYEQELLFTLLDKTDNVDEQHGFFF